MKTLAQEVAALQSTEFDSEEFDMACKAVWDAMTGEERESLDQMLFNRPFPGLGQYRGPFDNFYMCGSGTHPGGGVMGAPGANAADPVVLIPAIRPDVALIHAPLADREGNLWIGRDHELRILAHLSGEVYLSQHQAIREICRRRAAAGTPAA